MNPAALFLLSMALAVPAMAATTAAGQDCPAYVPHKPGGDYANADDREGLGVVEQFHFTPDVEKLIKGASGPLGGDIGYTLDHFCLLYTSPSPRD